MKKSKLFSSFLLLITGYRLQVSHVSAQFFGPIDNPLPKYASSQGEGIFVFISNIFKLVGTLAGIYMVFQIIMAGYKYISANGDPKQTEAAWAQIWQSIVGIVVIASAFITAGLVERFTGIKILNPVIYAPTNY
jgi:hypothetical protein